MQITIKDLNRESRLIQGRVFLASALIFLLVLLVVSRVFYLQVVQHDHFTTLSQHNRVKLLPVAPVRGLIFSSDNVLLAENRPAFTLEVIPERARDLEHMIEQLGELIRIEESDVDRFNALKKRKRRFEGIPLRFNLSDEEVARISVNRHRFNGVDIIARLNRYYPLGKNLSHTIGYMGMIDESELEALNRSNYSGTSHIGKLGVERAYEDLLHGRIGYQQVEVNAQGRKIREIDRAPAEPGKNLYLTLDVSLQNLAVQALDGRRGAIIAVDPNTGGVLASVSSPAYDPNLFVNGIDSQSYQALLQSKDAPLLNRPLQGRYPPGSTIKPFLGLSALNDGVREPLDETRCQGWYSLKGSGHRYRDWKKEGHGKMHLVDAIAQSCDVYFYALAHELGIDRIHAALSQFGFGRPAGIDIDGEATGLVPSREWKRRRRGEPWRPGETLITGIGQGSLLVTPLQLVMATAAIANKGKLVQPHLLSRVHDAITGEPLAITATRMIGKVNAAHQDYWDIIIESMREVVHGGAGTARLTGANSAYQFAGKTGTAQVITIGQDEEYQEEALAEALRDHALFIAFAPLDRPEIAVAIIVENGGSGSAAAAPIARLLFDHHLGKHRQRQG